MYPIGELIKNTIFSKRIKRSNIVKAAGYTNINKGLRHLDRCIYGEGRCSKEFVTKVLKYLEIDQNTIDVSIKETEEKLKVEQNERERKTEEYNRKHFMPHIYIKSASTRPSSIMAVAFAGIAAFKCIECPKGIQKWTIEEQINKVKEIIIQHYDENNGSSMFGAITGFIYWMTYDDGFEFTIDGDFIGASTKNIDDRTEVTIKIGNKVVSGGLLNIISQGVK